MSPGPRAELERRSGRAPLPVLRFLLLFVFTAAISTWLLGRVLPPVQIDALRVKLGALAVAQPPYDTIVIGSSMTYRGFEPEVFDAENLEAGIATRTFNLGLAGTHMAEAYEILRRVGELRLEGLRYVLIEADSIARLRDEDMAMTAKYIAYHDPATAWAEWNYLAALTADPVELWLARWRRLVATAYRQLGVGRCVPDIETALGMGVGKADRENWLGPRGDGFQALDDDRTRGVLQRRRQFERLRQAHDRDLRRMSLKAPAVEHVPSALRFFERLEELGRHLGVEVVFFSIRSGYLGGHAVGLAQAGQLDNLLRFDDDQAYPELYDASYTFDGLHFDRAGAKIFTRYLARAFAEQQRASEQ